ncbi:uncharacterized protein [Anabrus simplex]|uniref:uncharacterized protein isoform X2 n=1 Tax=Anabrus simplex TaxID=316456 RepID=UPI0035A2CD39
MLSLQQRIFVCKTYFKYESASRVRDEFVRNFPGEVPPSRTAIHNIVNKFDSTGSVENKKRKRKRTVLTEEKLDKIRENLEQWPNTSLRKLAQQVGVSIFSVHKATKLLKLKPRKDDASSICYKDMEVAPASDIKIEPHVEESEDCPSEEPSESTSPVRCEPEEVFLVTPKTEPDYPVPEESIKEEYSEYHSISPVLCIDKESRCASVMYQCSVSPRKAASM